MLPELALGADCEESPSNMFAAGCTELAPPCPSFQPFTVVQHVKSMRTFHKGKPFLIKVLHFLLMDFFLINLIDEYDQ